MKISCSKSELLNGVNIALKAVPNRTTMNILECIMIIVENGSIKLISNDTEMGIETTIKGNITENGIIALDAKLFSDVIRKLPEGDISIEVKDDLTTTIKCMKLKFNLPGRSGDDFVMLPSVKKDESITISQFTLKEVIRQTIFSVSDNDSNKLMTGILFDIEDDKLKVVSLDGHRISIRNIGLRKQYNNRKLIIPGKTLGEISKILSGEVEKEVNIYYTDKHVLFEFDNTILVSRLIEGEYFQYNQMFSEKYDTKITINRKSFLESIERATLLAKEGDKKPVIIGIEDDAIEVRMNSTIGSLNEFIDVTKEGNNLQIGFNPKFLIDALRVIDDEEIKLYMMNAKAPCFIEDDEKKYTYIVLPVNFNQVR
ncbi:MAG: DNA polymerase III subunit beta [Lachnospiraceae bacterium]|nr:DNA polymerase III subunit beta [Lachnospiraceae bacterium]